MNRKIVLAMLVTSSLGLAGCKTTAPEQLPPAQSSVAPTAPSAQPSQPIGPQPGSQEHFVQAINGQNVIYFDTDKYDIDSSDAAALQMQAQYLVRYPNISVTVEGHCDERGTRDYNLALGERRATAAKNYLVSLGIAASRISTVSYGKERPVALGSNPEAWAKNRRAVTVVIS